MTLYHSVKSKLEIVIQACFIIQIQPGQLFTSVVISPLNALMDEQVRKLREQNITSVAVHNKSEADIATRNHFNVIFTSPEFSMQESFRTLLLQTTHKLCVIAFDEAHCILEWGLSKFRPLYAEIAELLAISTDVPVLVMTATVSDKMKSDILTVLSIANCFTIACSPDRPEIFLEVRKKSATCLNWLIENLRVEKNKCEKTIIYCRSVLQVLAVYEMFLTGLGKDMYVDPTQRNVSNRLAEMYSSIIDKSTKERVLDCFSKCTNLRVIVTTVAFGMGIDIPDIRCVILWGIPGSCCEYWQQIGRACRDGSNGHAILYKVHSRLPINDDIKDVFCDDSSMCLRTSILEKIWLKDMGAIPVKNSHCDRSCDSCTCQLCLCCSNCRRKCPCVNT